MIQTKQKGEKKTTQADAIKDFASHSFWANRRIVEWLAAKPETLLDQQVISGFPSLKATISHIWDTQKYWLSNLKGIVEKPSYGQVFGGTAKELFDGFLANSEAFEQLVHSLTSEELGENISFLAPVRWPEWDEFERPAYELVLHALNHNTHHRGQLATIGRNLGLTDIPMTDFMYYSLVHKPTVKPQ